MAIAAGLSAPIGVAVDHVSNLYIGDTNNQVIRKVAPDGTISTFAGNHTVGYSGDGGPATSAQLGFPFGVAVDHGGALYIADSGNFVIRRVALDATISTVAGNHAAGYGGDGGPATSANLDYPWGVAVSGARLAIADRNNRVIRGVEPDSIFTNGFEQ